MALQKQDIKIEWYPLIVKSAHLNLETSLNGDILDKLDSSAKEIAESDVKGDKLYISNVSAIDEIIKKGESTKENTEKLQGLISKLNSLEKEKKLLEIKSETDEKLPVLGMVISMVMILIAGTSHKFNNTTYKLMVENKQITNFAQAIEFLSPNTDQLLNSPVTKEVFDRAYKIFEEISKRSEPRYQLEWEFMGNVNSFFKGTKGKFVSK